MDKLIFALVTSVGLAVAAIPSATASTLKREPAVAAGIVTTLSADGYEGRRHYRRHHYRYYRYSCRIAWPCPSRDPYAPRKDLGYYYWPGGPVPPFWWGL